MEITEVRIKLMEDSDDRLRAFCSITFDDCFVVRDLKIIEGSNGPFVAMPSRKLMAHCAKCGSKNHLRANYCNQCGHRARVERELDGDGRSKLYADIAHPINSTCREMIQKRVISGYLEELERSTQPGYVSRYDDYFEGVDDDYSDAQGGSAHPGSTVLQGPHRRKPEGPDTTARGIPTTIERDAPDGPPRAGATASDGDSALPDDRSPVSGSTGSVVPPPHRRPDTPRVETVGEDANENSAQEGGDDAFGAGIFD